MATTKSGLSSACDSVLSVWGMSAKPSEDGLSAEIHNDDGEYQATVRLAIDAADLLSLLRYGSHMKKLGKAQGEEEVKAGMRALIGAAAGQA